MTTILGASSGAFVQCTLSILPMCCCNGMVPAHDTDRT